MTIRNLRGEMNISPNKEIKISIANNTELQNLLETNKNLLAKVAKIFITEKINNEAKIGLTTENNLILIYTRDLIDPNEAIPIIEKKINNKTVEVTKIKEKLANQSYVAKAPAEVVAKDRQIAETIDAELSKLQEILAGIK